MLCFKARKTVLVKVFAAAVLAMLLFSSAYAEDWSPLWSTANLSQPRWNLSATSVGNQVFFAGGQTDSDCSSVVDIYDKSTGIWSTANLSQARTLLSAASVGGKAFFVGGRAGAIWNDVHSNVVDVYDLSTGVWSTASLSEARGSLAAASAGNKAIFAGGGPAGGNSSTVDIYDASTGTWSTANLSQARNSLAGASLGGRAYFGGGAIAVVGTPLTVVDIYDASANTWSTANLSQGRWDVVAAAAGDKVVFAGGLTAHYYGPGAVSNVVDIYSSSTGTWTTAALSQRRADLAAAAAGSKILFAGGWNGNPSNAVDICDASTGMWSTATVSQARSALAAASAGNQAFFAGGATVTGGGPSSVVDIYTLQNYSTITSSKTFTLVDQTTVAGRMQLNAPGSLSLAAFNLNAGSMSGDSPIDLGSGTLTAGGDGTDSVYSGAIGGGGGITKIGNGKLTLSGVNSYAGGTKIEDGILRITNPCLNDLAGVYVAVGAKLDLGFSGSDTVGSLYLDGLPAAAGTWGATGSGATNIDNVHFSGAGQLNVVPEPSALVLLGVGVVGLLGFAWRRRKRTA